MGSSESKETVEEEEEGRVYEPYLIQWDQHGHLRYGEAHKVDPGRQMVEIMELDYVDDTDGKKWYIIETAWLAAWLAHVHLDKRNAPAPGPCDNRRLIEWDAVQGKYVGRHGLLMSSKNNAGDFRRISRETWQKFREFYPGSGPSITMEYSAAMGNGEEPYIGKHFVILDPPPAPKVTISKSKKKKALAAAAAAEAAAAAKAADAAKAAQPGGAVHMGGYGSEDEAERTRSRSESSASFSVGTQNRPKVVASLPPPPGQPRNPVAEQYTRQAIAQANEETSRTSERSMSVASQQSASQHGAPPRYGSFSGGVPQQPPPPVVPGAAAPQRYNSFSGSVPPPAAHEAAPAAPVAAPKRLVSNVQDMYYAKD